MESYTATTDSDFDINDKEVNTIIQSIKEAEYFDAASMAPLSPASLVSSLFDSVAVVISADER